MDRYLLKAVIHYTTSLSWRDCYQNVFKDISASETCEVSTAHRPRYPCSSEQTSNQWFPVAITDSEGTTEPGTNGSSESQSVDNQYYSAIYCTIIIVTQVFAQCQEISCSFKEKVAMLTAERRRSIVQTLQREG